MRIQKTILHFIDSKSPDEYKYLFKVGDLVERTWISHGNSDAASAACNFLYVLLKDTLAEANLSHNHGIKLNGQIRGMMETRFEINVVDWELFGACEDDCIMLERAWNALSHTSATSPPLRRKLNLEMDLNSQSPILKTKIGGGDDSEDEIIIITEEMLELETKDVRRLTNVTTSKLKEMIAKLIQSANWSNKSCTLFVAVVRLLNETVWNERPSALVKNQSVSVSILNADGTFSGLYRYGEVREPWSRISNQSSVLVWHPTLKKSMYYHIDHIYLRKIESIPIIVTSNTKHHDSAFVRHFLDHIFLSEVGWVRRYGPRRFDEIIVCSDGAASQFKQKCTLYNCTELKDKYKSWIKRFTWSFGAPGHGKGTWDGLGGIAKNTLKRKIISNQLNLKTAEDVHRLLNEVFDSDDKRNVYVQSKDIKIKSWYFYYVEEDQLNPLRDTAAALNKVLRLIAGSFYNNCGSQKIFYYEMLEEGKLGLQIAPCWCHTCIVRTKYIRDTDKSLVKINEDVATNTLFRCCSREPYDIPKHHMRKDKNIRPLWATNAINNDQNQEDDNEHSEVT